MGASTIVVAREDLSIPGAAEVGNGAEKRGPDIETQFFNILRQHGPDVVVLDLTDTQGNGVSAILKIRHRSTVPIVVVCRSEDSLKREYCLAGAAECMQAPIDIMQLNQTVQQIIRLSRDSQSSPEQNLTQPASFSGMTLHPNENLLVGPDGATIKLTTSENTVLVHFVNNPWTLCTRDALAEVLYGTHRPNSDRAVDVIVTRLRKKIASLAGPAAQRLIKTEFRRGYVFVAEVSIGGSVGAAPPVPVLQARTA